ncbi:hypothetical protein M758_UG160400 [Ceratodon purpureus]|nr:hypothetical protein M758_UG160400 [Ceratodon purpureus]
MELDGDFGDELPVLEPWSAVNVVSDTVNPGVKDTRVSILLGTRASLQEVTPSPALTSLLSSQEFIDGHALFECPVVGCVPSCKNVPRKSANICQCQDCTAYVSAHIIIHSLEDAVLWGQRRLE